MRFTSIIMLSHLSLIPLLAQPNFEQGDSRGQNSLIVYQAVGLFRSDSALSRVDVHYRISQNFFIFVRNESANANHAYVARGELVVELLNDQRVSVAREIRQLPLSRPTLPRETDRTTTLQGVVMLTVRPGTYSIVFSVDDRESGRTFMERSKKISIPVLSSKAIETSELVFAQSSEMKAGSSLFIPNNRGGNTLFGETGCVLAEVYLPSPDDTLALRWTLSGKAVTFGQQTITLKGSAFEALPGLLDVLPHEQGVLYGIRGKNKNWKTVVIPLPLEKLYPGRFTLDVEYSAGSMRRQQSQQFTVVWPQQPLSLADPDLTLDALRHIATEEEIDQMQSGSIDRRTEAFHAFWRSKSQDTLTAYNVPMAEYFYRVDEAMRKYSTVREDDGYKTDRGRIYILYGKPDKADRMLQPNSSPMEVWTYDRFRKRFVFIDTSKNGNYILSQAENL